MNQNGLILWEKRDLKRIIWLVALLAVFVGIVELQVYRNRKFREVLQQMSDRNSYGYWEGVVIRALNKPQSLTWSDYQQAKKFGVFDRLPQEHPNYKPKITRLIQVVEKKPGVQPPEIKKEVTKPVSQKSAKVISKTKSKPQPKPKSKKVAKKKKPR